MATANGGRGTSSRVTLEEAAEAWLAAARPAWCGPRGEYKPSAVRAYRQALNHRVLPELGAKRSRGSVRTWCRASPTAPALKGCGRAAFGHDPPLRTIFRRAHQRGEDA